MIFWDTNRLMCGVLASLVGGVGAVAAADSDAVIVSLHFADNNRRSDRGRPPNIQHPSPHFHNLPVPSLSLTPLPQLVLCPWCLAL